MKKRTTLIVSLLIVLACGFPAGLAADDGSWSNSFSVQGGSIYSEQENSDVALIKELLIFDGGKTTVFFLFENTSAKEVRVTCGFPVRCSIDGYFENGSWYVSRGKYGPDDVPALAWFETEELESEVDEYGDPLFVGSRSVPGNAFNNSRNFISPAEGGGDIDFDIWQEENPVMIEKVLVERHCGSDGLSVILHYRHELVFKPKSRSVVRVEYTQDLVDGSLGGIPGHSYSWEYVIGTGRTWKGPIGELFFVKPVSWWKGEDALSEFRSTEQWDIYRAVNYEPGRDDLFVLTGSDTREWERYTWKDDKFTAILDSMKTIRPGGIPKVPAQKFVTGIKASSCLTDTTDVFTAEGVLKGAGYGPLSAFDGIPETAWCESVKGDGIGEYLEFTLTRPVWGLEILNGFTRLPLPDWLFESGYFDEEIRDDKAGIKDYYGLNNSVRVIQITDTKGKVFYTVGLIRTRGIQTLPGIILTPGTWRIVIGDVYKGSAWQDTCIGEIRFLEAETDKESKAFFGEPFYMEALFSLTGSR